MILVLEVGLLFVLGLVGWHLFSDWIIQPGDLGQRKEEPGVLFLHMVWYTVGLFLFMVLYSVVVGPENGPVDVGSVWGWIGLNGLLHGLVDGVSIRYSNHVTQTTWGKVGVLLFDQYVHVSTLLLTWVWLL